MNHFLIKIVLFLSIFYNNSIKSEEIKILFSIDEKAYTSIDLKNRINYIDIITNGTNFEYSEYLNDYISVLIFDKHASKNNIKINKDIIDNYLKGLINDYINIDNNRYNDLINLNSNQKNFLIKNIRYDYQKKLILEKILSKKQITENTENNILDLYNIEIKYFTFNNDYKYQINDFINLIKTKEINEIDKELKLKSINYNFNNRKIINLVNIDNEIKESIFNNKKENFFSINNIDNFVIGWVEKKIRNNIELKYTFFQITSLNQLDQDSIKCQNIDFLSKNENVKIKKFEKIDLNKINDAIKNNLNSINDFILINNNNKRSYIILCNLNYNKELSKKHIFNEKIDKEVKEIENDFLLQKKIEFNFKLYE